MDDSTEYRKPDLETVKVRDMAGNLTIDTIFFSRTGMRADSPGLLNVHGICEDTYATSYDWGRRRIGHDYGPATIYIHNLGTASVRVVSFDLNGDTDQFKVVGGSQIGGSLIEAGDSIALQVEFSPSSTGTKHARLIYQIDPASPFEISSDLHGFGTKPVLSTTDYDFGSMMLRGERRHYQGSVPIAFWVPDENEFDSVTITGFEFTSDAFGDSSDFGWQPLSIPVPIVLHAGERYEVDGWFRAQALGRRSAALRAITSDGMDTTSHWYGYAALSSVDGAEAGGGLSISPNPASGSTLRLRYDPAVPPVELSLADPLGRIIGRLSPGEDSRGNGSLSIDITGIPAGNYFLRARSHTGVRTLPVTIVR